MRDVVVFKTPHDVHHRVHFADMGQEFVAQSFAVRRAFDQSRDVHEFEYGRRDLFAVIQRREFVQPLVRHRDDADVRLDRAERIVRALRARLRDRIE